MRLALALLLALAAPAGAEALPVSPSAVLPMAPAEAAPVTQGLRFLMLEQPGCLYCARWHADVGDAWPKTEAGKAAPLAQAFYRSPPEGVTLARPANFTPTFVLLRDGVEIGRIEGYAGEDFFWPMAEEMIFAALHTGE